MEFTLLHPVLSKLFKKSILALVIPFCSIFLINHKVVPLVFFRFWWKVRQSRFRDFNNFMTFSEKRKSFEFTLLHPVLLELLKKWFYYLKSHFVSFFIKHRVVPYVFFRFWILIKVWKNQRVVPYVLYKKCNKIGFQEEKSTFWAILVKHDVIG